MSFIVKEILARGGLRIIQNISKTISAGVSVNLKTSSGKHSRSRETG